MNKLTRILLLIVLVILVLWAVKAAFRIGMFVLVVGGIIYLLSQVKIKS